MKRIETDIRRLVTCLLGLALLLPAAASAQDDTALFTANVAPNVLLVVDNSGSMRHLVWHPAFDPSVDYTVDGLDPLNPSDDGCDNWSNNSSYTYSSDVVRNVCGNSRTLYIDPLAADDTRISGSYLNWYFSDYADAYVTDIQALANGSRSSCLISLGLPTTYAKYRRQRVTAARDVLREVVCQVNAVGTVRFGLAKFYDGTDPKGGFVRVPIDDFTPTQESDIYNEIDTFSADTNTPLGETLYNIYLYFQNRTDPAEGKVSGEFFPDYDLGTDGSQAGSCSGWWCDPNPTPTVIPPSPVQYACQKHFVVIITDGTPTRDDFDSMNHTEFVNDLIGDFNPDNTSPEAGDEEPGNDVAYYLDDIAKFMAEEDFRPDIAGDQTIDVYTVGFTTGQAANDLLSKTASVGNGLFKQSNNAEELANHLVQILADVVEKSQSFTAATVPASRATDGNNFYASYFLPSPSTAFWEGHIKNFEFNAAGEILDSAGNCALNDPVPNQCKSGTLKTTANGFWDAQTAMPGSSVRKLLVSDYASGLPATTPATPPAFTTANMSATDLVTGTDVLGVPPYAPSDFPTNTATTGNDLRDRIVDYIRGCAWDSSPCVDRSKRLADVFHSNPLLVGPPNAAHEDPSYRQFAAKYRHRPRMLYAGSNGGFLHGFFAGEWQTGSTPPAYDRGTGVEQFGFMTYPARHKIKDLAKDIVSPKQYLMDGQVQAADVWFYPTATASPSHVDEWHTVLVGNMRQGGRVVFALDATDPPDTAYPNGQNMSLPYPGYLWEFPCEATAAQCQGLGAYTYAQYMGETWSDPIIVKIRAEVSSDDNNGKGYDRWVAIFGAGYDAAGDPNTLSWDSTVTSLTSRAGRAVMMVDVMTGELIAMKRFDHSSTQGDPRMKFAFPSTPAVFDTDFDDYADVVYIGDLGGNLWKWVIDDFVTLPITADADLDQSQWEWVRMFEGDHCTFNAANNPTQCATDHYKSFFYPPTGSLVHGSLWLAFGTGERAKLDFPGYPLTPRENNRVYVMQDVDPLEELGTTLTSAARYDDFPSSTDFLAATNPDACNYPVAPQVGYYIEAQDGEKFVTNSVIFFGNVFTLSFVPDSTNDPCSSGGTARLYGFNLFCGEAVFIDPNGNGTQKMHKFDVGYGVPNRPRTSVGPVNTDVDPNCTGPNCDLSCKNMVVVITSDGNAYSDSPSSACPSGIRLQSYRDF